jgi:polysaccharide export outer membrane protein
MRSSVTGVFPVAAGLWLCFVPPAAAESPRATGPEVKPPVQNSAFAAQAYALGPEDVVKISVWKDEGLTNEVVVRPDGMISFPLVGDVLAEGKSVEELRGEITRRLTRFIPTPTVSVTVMKVHSYKIYVIGKVNKPGEYQVGHYTDVLQALSLAGGVTPFAAEGKIKILRRVKGEQVVFPFDYSDALKGQGLERNIILNRWDTVMVP